MNKPPSVQTNPQAAAPVRLSFGPFLLDEANARLSRSGRAVDLQPKELAVLCELARRPGQLVTKDQLLDAVWGHPHISESVLKTIVSHLRAALDDDARQPRCIETVSRRGYRFIAAAGGAPAAELPPALAAADAATALIGRQQALARLQAGLQAARRGQRQVLLVAGEAGIGKTTLIDGFVAALGPDGAAVARGQCVEHRGAGEPYMPVLEALDLLCRSDHELLALMRSAAPTWLVQLPWYLGEDDRRQLQREVAGATQDRMLREAGELLDRCSARRALVLVLEDLHWSDHATVQLIAYLARRRSSAGLLLVGSFRAAEVIAAEHPLGAVRQELRLHRLCEEIDLEAFSEADVGRLLAERLDGAQAPDDFVQALHAHTGGLPLFVVSLLDELIAEAALRRGETGWVFPDAGTLRVPSHIAEVLEMQIARLPAEQQRALGLASVAGIEFLHLPLAEVLRTSPDGLQRLLDDTAARRQWLRSAELVTLPGGQLASRYAFRHAIYRQVFYQRLPAGQRAQWHRDIAQALQASAGTQASELAAELALHFERGGLPAAAVRQLVTVARRALARSAAREALHASGHGLALLARHAADDADTELDLRVLEGVALTRLYVLSQPEVAQAFERTRALCERAPASPARARALHGLWWVSFARGELARAQQLAQQIVDLAEATAEPALRLAGCSTMGLTLTMRGDFVKARQQLQAALTLHDAIGEQLPPGMFVQDPGVETRGYLALVSWWLGEPAQARQLIEAAVARAFAIRHPVSQLIALHLSAGLHFFAGEAQAALVATERLQAVVREQDLPTAPGGFAWLHGHAVAALGDAERGLEEMRAGERSCRALGLLIGITGFHLHHARACRDAGLLDEAMNTIETGLQLAQGGHEHYLLSPLHLTHAELLASRGQSEAAAASLQRALDIAEAQGARFHEMEALLSASRLKLMPPGALRGRLRTLLPAYDSERIAVAQQARALVQS